MGTLYVVPTPVGNLEDITYRALRILKEADLILADDTRTSGNLLRHFEIKNAMQSYHKFNEHQTVSRVVERLLAGETVGLTFRRPGQCCCFFFPCVRLNRQLIIDGHQRTLLAYHSQFPWVSVKVLLRFYLL